MEFEAKPGDVIGAYNIIKYLNSGGMAYVVLGSCNRKEYALKITRVTSNMDQNEQNNNSTRKEAFFLKNLSHDRIVKIFPLKISANNSRMKRKKIFYARAMSAPGSPWYFAMEYLAGGTLGDYTKKCGPLTVAESTNIVGNIGLALGYLHEKSIVHCDIKPENVVFRKKIKKGQPYTPVLIDFGTAAGVNKFVDEAGSWYVMSPERIRRAKGIDPPETASEINPAKADIWSLAIVLYQALVGSLPFSSLSQKGLTSQILNDIPASITKQISNVPSALDRFIVHDCLAKNPQDRPTIHELLEFIFEYSGRGVLATSIKDNYYGKE